MGQAKLSSVMAGAVAEEGVAVPTRTLKRILLVSDMGVAQPSGWTRAVFLKPWFPKFGIEADYVFRRSPSLNRFLERQGPIASRFAAAGVTRPLRLADALIARVNELRILRMAHRYDAIYLQKITSPKFVAELRKRTSARIVYDFSDAVWLKWRADYAGARVLENLKHVDAVTTDNAYTRGYIERLNPNVYIFPDTPQVESFDVRREQVLRMDSPIRLGWVGTPGTCFNLYHIWEPLERLFAKHPNLELRLVGVGRDHKLLPRFENVRYSTVPHYDQQRMVEEVLRMHIGLFPMFDTEDSVSRGILKASVYMAGGAVAVASPRGQVKDFIQSGINGFTPDSAAEWEEVIERLIQDRSLRERVSQAGLDTIREQLNTPKVVECLVAALRGDPLPHVVKTAAV